MLLVTNLIAQHKFFADKLPVGTPLFKIHQGKGRDLVLPEQIARVDQEAGSQALAMKDMVMAVTNQMKLAGAGEFTGQFRIMVKRDPPAVEVRGAVGSMVMNIGKDLSATGRDEMLVSGIVAVNQMHGSVKGVQVAEHER